ncbi:hypothetical protein EJ110_NYTH28062 [Nymphaea thermarum]|nr:hypothetical protein EJ110_NYTH28062 [Nymphaea thermarum]
MVEAIWNNLQNMNMGKNHINELHFKHVEIDDEKKAAFLIETLARSNDHLMLYGVARKLCEVQHVPNLKKLNISRVPKCCWLQFTISNGPTKLSKRVLVVMKR